MIIDSLEELQLGQGLLVEMIDFLTNPSLLQDLFKIVCFLQEPQPGQGLLIRIISFLAKYCKMCPASGPGPWYLESGAYPGGPLPSPGQGASCGMTGWEAPASYATHPTVLLMSGGAQKNTHFTT